MYLAKVTSSVFRRGHHHFSPQTVAVSTQLTKLEITVDHHNRFNMCPLPSMINLKWLYLDLGSAKNLIAHQMNALEALKSLKTLVNLEGLELTGFNKNVRLADKCAKEVFPEWACENLRWLAFREIQDKAHQTSTFTGMIDKFTKLEHLSFKISKAGKNLDRTIDCRCDDDHSWLSAHGRQVPTPTSQNLELEQQMRIF